LLGDPTPRSQGRQSLRLRAHLDPMGTLLCVVLAFLPVGSGPLGLGWGKPVETDAWKLRGGPNFGTLLVALSGIVVSLAIGLLVAFAMRLLPSALFTSWIGLRVVQFIEVFAVANVVLGLFNLLPLHPLDGYKILFTLLPSRHALKFGRSAQYGPLIIIVLLFVLPFLGSITNTGDFFLFRLSYYLMQGVIGLISIASGLPFGNMYSLYNIF
ncbi:MAG: site-2 protease family protein, partial [Ktedonobacteraceae bacterium]